MCVQFKTALAVLFVASVPLHLRAKSSSSEPLGAKEVRRAEAQASTSADHQRLAAWYQSEDRQTQTRLTVEEDLVKSLGQKPGVVDRTKIPNPYWNARAWAGIYRAKLEKVTKLAVDHERMAGSLQAGVRLTQ